MVRAAPDGWVFLMWWHGRAKVDSSAPEAFACCDRCGFLYNISDLDWQYEWRGNQLQNLRLLVCARCLDVPFIFNRPIILPPDPVPIRDPRSPFWAQQEATPGYNPQYNIVTADGDDVVTQDDDDLVYQLPPAGQ